MLVYTSYRDQPGIAARKELKVGVRITRRRDGVIDKRALMFLFIVLMAAFGAIALIILFSGS